MTAQTYSTKTIIFLVVCRLLDVVSSDDGRVSVLVIAFPFDEVDFSKELLLVMLQFADHVWLCL